MRCPFGATSVHLHAGRVGEGCLPKKTNGESPVGGLEREVQVVDTDCSLAPGCEALVRRLRRAEERLWPSSGGGSASPAAVTVCTLSGNSEPITLTISRSECLRAGGSTGTAQRPSEGRVGREPLADQRLVLVELRGDR